MITNVIEAAWAVLSVFGIAEAITTIGVFIATRRRLVGWFGGTMLALLVFVGVGTLIQYSWGIAAMIGAGVLGVIQAIVAVRLHRAEPDLAFEGDFPFGNPPAGVTKGWPWQQLDDLNANLKARLRERSEGDR